MKLSLKSRKIMVFGQKKKRQQIMVVNRMGSVKFESDFSRLRPFSSLASLPWERRNNTIELFALTLGSPLLFPRCISLPF